jgi:hypothetical protein
MAVLMQHKCAGCSTQKVREYQPVAGLLQCRSYVRFAVLAMEPDPCHLQGRPSAQAVGCRPLPTHARSFSHASARGICGGLLENGIYISVLQFRPVSIIH